MSTEILYQITIKNVNIHAIADKLKKLNLDVKSWKIEDVGRDAYDPDHIMCSEMFFESDPIIGLTNIRIQKLKKIDGIEKVEIMHEKKLKANLLLHDYGTEDNVIQSASTAYGILLILAVLILKS